MEVLLLDEVILGIEEDHAEHLAVKYLIIWQGRRDSNPRSLRSERSALDQLGHSPIEPTRRSRRLARIKLKRAYFTAFRTESHAPGS